jgi:NADPH-dependent 2,4-dienoyl-CoA reductase/sulfur reductase-like enzyme
MTAASQARRRLDRAELSIVAFDRGGFASYSACGIPYWIAGDVPSRDDLIVRTPAVFATGYGIDVRLHHEVTAIDLPAREITVSHDGREWTEPFDHLLYATGATPVIPDWAKTRAQGVFGVQTLNDGDAVHSWLDRSPAPSQAVVVGGGYIGVEMAEALVRRGMNVTLLEKADQPMSTVDPDMGALVRDAMAGLGIDVRTGVTVTGLSDHDGTVDAVLTSAGPVPADIVILGLGVRPNTALAKAAGFPIGESGGIAVDPTMAVTGLHNIWAAGDCVESLHRITGRGVHIPLGTHANKQGRIAGINIGGGHATFPGVIGTAVTKVCDLEVARTGLRESEATQAGLDFITATIESTSRAGYIPGAAILTVKLIAERPTGRLLGAQIVGRSESAKRIDPLAVALWNNMTVEEMTSLDLGYAPPFAPVWDPVLVAARKAADKLAASR